MDDGANIEPTPVAPAAFACFSICTSFLGAAIHNLHTKALRNDSERAFYYLYRWNGYLNPPLFGLPSCYRSCFYHPILPFSFFLSSFSAGAFWKAFFREG